MKRTDLPPRLGKIIDSISYVNIATVCQDGQPWNTPVFARFDSGLNLYWVSHVNAQHSVNVAREPRIFVTLYDSTVPEGEGVAVYSTMIAKVLDTDLEIVDAKKVYDTSFFGHKFPHKQFLGSCPQRFYKAIPKQVWYNSDSTKNGHFIDVRKKINL